MKVSEQRMLVFQPVYVIIERDDETKKIQASIKAGMSANASHLQSYLSTWDRYAFYQNHALRFACD